MRTKLLWKKAKHYTKKLRFQARLQKMAEQNQREMIVEDVADEGDEENQIIDNEPKLEWYLIDTESNFAKAWNFIITLIVIYNLIVTPFFLVFPGIYRCN